MGLEAINTNVTPQKRVRESEYIIIGKMLGFSRSNDKLNYFRQLFTWLQSSHRRNRSTATETPDLKWCYMALLPKGSLTSYFDKDYARLKNVLYRGSCSSKDCIFSVSLDTALFKGIQCHILCVEGPSRESIVQAFHYFPQPLVNHMILP
ncbi:hypothetical protein Ciccas_012276 [Cichlidogyrus casuarinus]|uniref:Uncharacterized protein n=1 Tax=Cichlidogyrus casuarinus TaxID=1844966 RepID=A0ABD2PRW2_9PLAT